MKLSGISVGKLLLSILLICLSNNFGYARNSIGTIQTQRDLYVSDVSDEDGYSFNQDAFRFDEGLIENNVISHQHYSYSRVRVRIDSSRNYRFNRLQFRLLLSSKNRALYSNIRNMLFATKYFRLVELAKDFFVITLRELLI